MTTFLTLDRPYAPHELITTASRFINEKRHLNFTLNPERSVLLCALVHEYSAPGFRVDMLEVSGIYPKASSRLNYG